MCELDLYCLEVYRTSRLVVTERQTDRHDRSYLPHRFAWSLDTWQSWRSHHWIHRTRKNSLLHENLMTLCFTEPELWPIEFSHCGNRDFRPFCFSKFDLDPITMRELDLYCLGVYRMCKYELPTSRLVVWQTDRQTDRKTRPNLYTTPLREWSKNTRYLSSCENDASKVQRQWHCCSCCIMNKMSCLLASASG